MIEDNVCGIDLAAQFSAFVLIAQPNLVLAQSASWGIPASTFLDKIVDAAFEHNAVIVCEDLPPRVPWSIQVKEACRLQGKLEEMASQRAALTVHYVQPATWQRYYIAKHNMLKRNIPVSHWRIIAEREGYKPPMLMHEKIESDFIDAYLIARWYSLIR
jgi:hypothetical protein